MATILICEDDPSVARLVALTFGLDGHDCTILTDGDQGAARLDGHAADLVVLDVMMPGRDGLEVLRDLRSRPAWGTCRVILLTALSTDADVWRGWSSGADYYLTKPFDIGHLCAVGERLLRGESLEPETA